MSSKIKILLGSLSFSDNFLKYQESISSFYRWENHLFIHLLRQCFLPRIVIFRPVYLFKHFNICNNCSFTEYSLGGGCTNEYIKHMVKILPLLILQHREEEREQ